MQVLTALKTLTGLGPSDLFYGAGGALVDMRDADGVIKIVAWRVPNIPRPTEDAWSALLAAPEPGASRADLLAMLETKQDAVLGQIWAFDVGTADAPLKLTTRLDDRGIRSMQSLALWAIFNATATSATESYTNVDWSTATLTPAQAASLSLKALAVGSQTYDVCKQAAPAIQATPMTITSAADIDALAWPVPA